MHLITQMMKNHLPERKSGKKQQPENSKIMAALEAVKNKAVTSCSTHKIDQQETDG